MKGPFVRILVSERINNDHMNSRLQTHVGQAEEERWSIEWQKRLSRGAGPWSDLLLFHAPRPHCENFSSPARTDHTHAKTTMKNWTDRLKIFWHPPLPGARNTDHLALPVLSQEAITCNITPTGACHWNQKIGKCQAILTRGYFRYFRYHPKRVVVTINHIFTFGQKYLNLLYYEFSSHQIIYGK